VKFNWAELDSGMFGIRPSKDFKGIRVNKEQGTRGNVTGNEKNVVFLGGEW